MLGGGAEQLLEHPRMPSMCLMAQMNRKWRPSPLFHDWLLWVSLEHSRSIYLFQLFMKAISKVNGSEASRVVDNKLAFHSIVIHRF